MYVYIHMYVLMYVCNMHYKYELSRSTPSPIRMKSLSSEFISCSDLLVGGDLLKELVEAVMVSPRSYMSALMRGS